LKSNLFGALLLTPVVAIVDWQLLASSSWWYVVWLGTPVVGIAMIAAGRVKRLPFVAAIGLMLILSGLTGGVLAWFLNQNQLKANQHQCEQVAAALEQHRNARGSYPAELVELVPDFLAELPVLPVGILASAPLLYKPPEQAGSFAIGYQPMRGVALLYSKGKWSAVPMPW
jgi:hypothetical protein